jgi:endonuclease/exonuclease/phosphatase family metal-dependent hydrolase
MTRSNASLITLYLVFGGLLMAGMRGGERPDTLRIATLNTHLLPRVGQPFASHRGQPEYRAEKIGRWLASYDLVGLCEVFDDGYRQILLDAAQRSPPPAFQVLWTPKPLGRAFANSGLLLLSRFPIVEQHEITYAHASRFLTYGFRADAFAAKGALHARLLVNERRQVQVDCFLTHLESRSEAARARQLDDLAKFIAEHGSPQRPAILFGDLNVPADPAGDEPRTGSPYARLLAALGMSGLAWGDVWPVCGAGAGGTSDPQADEGGKRIDYVFLSPLKPPASSAWRPTAAGALRLPDNEVAQGSLSDHAAVELEAELSLVMGQ